MFKPLLLLGTVLILSGSSVEIAPAAAIDFNATMSMSEIQPKKDVFGANLFNGRFAQNRQYRYDPAYLLNIGDTINVKLWGAVDYAAVHTVDTQGNIFIPKVGTVKVQGIRNENLSSVVSEAVKRIYKSNVYSYADLQNYQPVSVFVTGSVNSPGLYEGLSSDSVIQFVDKAKGVDLEHGSFRNVSVLRNNQLFKQVDLYDFLLTGNLELFQFKTGDVIVVDSIKHYVTVSGDVKRPYRFELKTCNTTLKTLAEMAVVNPTATNVMITRYNQQNEQQSSFHSLINEPNIEIECGNTVEFVPDHTLKNMTIYIEGEHQGLHNLVVPKGASLDDVLKKINYTSLSDQNSVQLFRKSVAERQKELIEAQLRDLEQTALTTGSATSEEALIRKQESALILDFIKRAKEVEPKGQVVLNDGTDYSRLILEEGDKIYIPSKTNTVIVQGEVMLPGAQSYVPNLTFDDYISSSGGFNFRANKENVLIIHPNGKAEIYDASFGMLTEPNINPGDSILILGKVDSKDLQIVKDITQILYQIAVGAAVIIKAY